MHNSRSLRTDYVQRAKAAGMFGKAAAAGSEARDAHALITQCLRLQSKILYFVDGRWDRSRDGQFSLFTTLIIQS